MLQGHILPDLQYCRLASECQCMMECLHKRYITCENEPFPIGTAAIIGNKSVVRSPQCHSPVPTLPKMAELTHRQAKSTSGMACKRAFHMLKKLSAVLAQQLAERRHKTLAVLHGTMQANMLHSADCELHIKQVH